MLELYVRSMSARMDDILIITCTMEIYTRITQKDLWTAQETLLCAQQRSIQMS